MEEKLDEVQSLQDEVQSLQLELIARNELISELSQENVNLKLDRQRMAMALKVAMKKEDDDVSSDQQELQPSEGHDGSDRDGGDAA